MLYRWRSIWWKQFFVSQKKKKVKHYLNPSKNVITFLVRNDLTHTKDLQT